MSPQPPQDVDIQDIDRQFETDAPRIAFFVNDISLDSTHTRKLSMYLHKWSNTHTFDPTVVKYWCTQTALAPVYVHMVNLLTAAETHTVQKTHLIDGGYQHIVIRSSGLMSINKPFKILRDDQSMQTVGTLMLHIDVHPTNAHVKWVYQMASTEYSWQDLSAVYTTLTLIAAWGALHLVS